VDGIKEYVSQEVRCQLCKSLLLSWTLFWRNFWSLAVVRFDGCDDAAKVMREFFGILLEEWLDDSADVNL
jgi:hypothetical protein